MGENMTEAGTITDIQNCGTIVMVILRTTDHRLVHVPFDHRSFSHLLQSENCTGRQMIGRPATFDGTNFFFLDEASQ